VLLAGFASPIDRDATFIFASIAPVYNHRMLVFSIVLLRQPCAFPSQTIAIGIWAGKETFSNRLLSQAQTWMRFWESIHVFTDSLPDGSCEALNVAAVPCHVICVPIGDLAGHLEGTEWQHRWYFAQPRILPSMLALWEISPNSSWYLFGDDDTYFFRASIERKISSLNFSRSLVVGKFWSSWQRVTQDVPPLRDEHPFAQGGAGVLLSSVMMGRLAPHLKGCSIAFNDPDFAGAMRFALCAEKVVGQAEWSPNRMILSWPAGFHSSPPDSEIEAGTVSEAPASFHQMKPDLFQGIWGAHALEFVRNGSVVSVDLGLMAFTKNRIRLGIEQNAFEWRFGYWIAVEDSFWPMVRAIGNWTAVLNNGELTGFRQKYEREIEVICECDGRIRTGKAHFSHFADEIGSRPVMKLDCSRFSFIKSRPSLNHSRG
jgi:hypothetical protein